MLNVLLTALALALPGEPGAPATVTGNEPVTTGGVPDLALAKNITAFKAGQVFIGDGTSIEDGVVLVADGVIAAVGQGVEIPASAVVVEHAGAISPGMIALHSKEGVGGELYDETRVTLPDADASYAFQPTSHDFYHSCAAGITSVVLVPSSESLIGGQSAVVKTRGGSVVKRGAQLALGLSSEALHSNKFPTSYDGAMGELDRLFTNPEGPVAKAVAGNLPVLMSVGDRAEIQRALAFAARFGLNGALLGSYWSADLAGEIKASGLSVVCTPFDVGEDQRALRSVTALAAAGVRIGFGLDAPERSPESLRLGAAAYVRAGMDENTARRALTGDAAAIAGVAGRVGSLTPGLDADLVLWSGDPVLLTSSVDAVYIDGKRVVGGEK
jgi:imidazolonepropionase-like amidohydrolase